ncbi:MAG: hypothetical protein A2086_16255 [Spirochaetes bacterium GWD1_27_9]|nr:MAG: hypothetical protein A2Z98_13820 [Spirochaetes bacterium GWB1_27_13]OHD28706.1 MAG: hypothetical protein A2086_16255 [Spirochaetes bacterium GWD1_27_9]
MKNIIIILFLICSFSLYADGFIIVNPEERASPFVLEVKNHNVTVEINDLYATTNIDQTFYNPTNRNLEGIYLFPVPKGAVIKKFSMFINGKEMQAELLDASKARKIYEDIVRVQLDPALLEYDGVDVFRVRIFPIEPRSEKRVKISYNEILNKDMGTVEYLYPLNTEKFSTKPLQNVSITVNIKSSDEVKNVYSTTHNVDIVKKDKNFMIASYEENNTKPDIDFKLYFSTQNSKIGMSLITYKEKDDDGFFYINITPSFDINKEEIEEKDVTFVLDNSGSMNGKNMEQAKKALEFCVNSLNEKDRFEIIRFSTEAESFTGKLNPINKENKAKAMDFIKKIEPIGGTNIEEALKLAIASKDNSNRLHIIVFITDGKPTIGETTEDKLIKMIEKENKNNVRIFTFGIGYDINIHLLDKITELTKAYRSYITPDEDIEVKISNFFVKINSPVLTNINLKFNGNVKVSKMYPKELGDLFKGSSLSLIGRYTGNGDVNVELTGIMNKKSQNYKFSANFPLENTKDGAIPQLWASRRIGFLLDQIRLHKEEKEIVDEIVILARKYGIVTPYTSYLIVEDETRRTERNDMPDIYQTFNKKDNRGLEENKKTYDKMKTEKSGEGGVTISKELQDLNQSNNINETQKQRIIKDNEGNQIVLQKQYKNIQGRAVYQTDNYWVDSKLQTLKSTKVNKIKFASKEYFELLKKYPDSAKFLSLGKNVRFVLNNEAYEVFE